MGVHIAAGEEHLIQEIRPLAHAARPESEFTAIRTILSGRMAGLDAETIRERLREAYV